MIKINLLGNKTAIDHTSRLILAGYLLSVGLVLLVCFLLQAAGSTKVSRLTSQSEQLDIELKRLQEITAEVRDLESKKQELNSKLNVIGILKQSKHGPVRVLDDLNLALPDRAWVVSLKERGGALDLQGMALDNQTIAGFMKDIDASDYYGEVDLIEAKIAQWKGVAIREFMLKMKVNYTGNESMAQELVAQKGKKKG